MLQEDLHRNLTGISTLLFQSTMPATVSQSATTGINSCQMDGTENPFVTLELRNLA